MQRVTAALIERHGRLLLARRKPGRHLGAKWEFPGGKIDPGESAAECVRRELAEEFEIEVEVEESLGRTRFRHGEIDLEIEMFRVHHRSGRFVLHEHEEIRWVRPREVERYDLVDSDRALYRAFLRPPFSFPLPRRP